MFQPTLLKAIYTVSKHLAEIFFWGGDKFLFGGGIYFYFSHTV